MDVQAKERHPARARSYPQALIALAKNGQGLAKNGQGLAKNGQRLAKNGQGLAVQCQGMTFQPRPGGAWRVPNKQY